MTGLAIDHFTHFLARYSRAEDQADFDFTREDLANLRGPTGLPIGSPTPPEIAVSTIAAITAVSNGTTMSQYRAVA